MGLARITFTGADKSVEPADLTALSAAYPFCEWGILFSGKMYRPRYPGWDWIWELQRCAAATDTVPVALALHLCGQQARDVLGGHYVAKLLDHWLTGFQRVQLNFGQVPLPLNFDPFAFAEGLQQFGLRQLIFQVASEASRLYLADMNAWCREGLLDCVPLFDASGGQGKAPEVWPKPWDLTRRYPSYGYAGALGPHNLAEQLPRILEAAGDVDVWIDMETGVRTEDRFDLAKVEQCLRIAEPFVREKGQV